MSIRSESFVSGETRDSKLRQFFGPAIESSVKFLYKNAPWLTPDVLTFIGTVGVMSGSILAIREQSKSPEDQRPLVGLTITTLSQVTDAIDGSAARFRRQVLNIKSNAERGMLVDVINDRVQELVMALSRAINARGRQDQWGTHAALFSAITNTLPSVIRARAERKGYTVGENGNSLHQLLGSRFGRAILGVIALHLPEIKSIRLQPVIDTVVSVANVALFVERTKILQSGKQFDVSEEMRCLGKKREQILTVFTALATISALITFIAIEKKES